MATLMITYQVHTWIYMSRNRIQTTATPQSWITACAWITKKHKVCKIRHQPHWELTWVKIHNNIRHFMEWWQNCSKMLFHQQTTSSYTWIDSTDGANSSWQQANEKISYRATSQVLRVQWSQPAPALEVLMQRNSIRLQTVANTANEVQKRRYKWSKVQTVVNNKL